MWNPFKPKIENSDPGQRSLQLISQKGMPFAYVEAYKSLRTNLNFLTSSTGARAIVVTSTMPEEAKSNVSVNLALTLAEDGKNVALVDCDLRKPVLHKYLKAGHNVKAFPILSPTSASWKRLCCGWNSSRSRSCPPARPLRTPRSCWARPGCSR